MCNGGSGGVGVGVGGGVCTAPWQEDDAAFDPPPQTDAEFLRTAMFVPSRVPVRTIPRLVDDDDGVPSDDRESCHKEAPVRCSDDWRIIC